MAKKKRKLSRRWCRALSLGLSLRFVMQANEACIRFQSRQSPTRCLWILAINEPELVAIEMGAEASENYMALAKSMDEEVVSIRSIAWDQLDKLRPTDRQARKDWDQFVKDANRNPDSIPVKSIGTLSVGGKDVIFAAYFLLPADGVVAEPPG